MQPVCLTPVAAEAVAKVPSPMPTMAQPEVASASDLKEDVTEPSADGCTADMVGRLQELGLLVAAALESTVDVMAGASEADDEVRQFPVETAAPVVAAASVEVELLAVKPVVLPAVVDENEAPAETETMVGDENAMDAEGNVPGQLSKSQKKVGCSAGRCVSSGD